MGPLHRLLLLELIALRWNNRQAAGLVPLLVQRHEQAVETLYTFTTVLNVYSPAQRTALLHVSDLFVNSLRSGTTLRLSEPSAAVQLVALRFQQANLPWPIQVKIDVTKISALEGLGPHLLFPSIPHPWQLQPLFIRPADPSQPIHFDLILGDQTQKELYPFVLRNFFELCAPLINNIHEFLFLEATSKDLCGTAAKKASSQRSSSRAQGEENLKQLVLFATHAVRYLDILSRKYPSVCHKPNNSESDESAVDALRNCLSEIIGLSFDDLVKQYADGTPILSERFYQYAATAGSLALLSKDTMKHVLDVRSATFKIDRSHVTFKKFLQAELENKWLPDFLQIAENILSFSSVKFE